MISLVAVTLALALTASAQAMSLAPLHQQDGLMTQVREACGAGMSASVLPPAGTPPGVQLECMQWAAVALNEVP